jgi:muramidase (phage lysozyme)
MNRTLLAAAVVVLAAAWWWTKDEDESGGDALPGVLEDAVEAVDAITGGVMKLSAMGRVSPAVLSDRNVQAFLRVIRRGEGTGDEGGYRRLFGGGTFASFADHPRVTVKKSGYTSTAAGAYQFLKGTWDETSRAMGLDSFSPANQDLGAVGRIAARGALADVIAGRLEEAVKKCAKEWASLPYSTYGQPVISMATARNVFASAGGYEVQYA